MKEDDIAKAIEKIPAKIGEHMETLGVLTTGRKVVLSIMVPVVSGFVLSFVEVKTNITYFPGGGESFDIAHLYNCWWAGGGFGLCVLAFLWLLWKPPTKGK